MKNLYLIPTDKPSRLGKFIDTNNLFLRTSNDIPRGENVHIYITSDEEIKKGDFFIYRNYKLCKCTGLSLNKQILTDNEIAKHKDYGKPQGLSKKIILTTDQDLIKDGVQAIDDEFLEWFVQNPSCEEVKIDESTLLNTSRTFLGVEKYKIIIPKEEPKQETLEEAAENYTKDGTKHYMEKTNVQLGFKEGAKWQQERMYSEEDMGEAFKGGGKMSFTDINQETQEPYYYDFNEWFKQFKKK